MRILIINISLRPNSEKIIFPIGLGYIATAIERAGFDFEILDLDALRPTDLEIEDYIKKTNFDVVAFGCIVTGYKYVKKLAELIKKYKNVPIIAGNSVATSIPEILLKKTKVDIGVMGEGDITIIELLKAIENKTSLDEVKGIFFRKNENIFFTPERELILDLDELPFINYDLFNMGIYLDKCRFNVGEPYPIRFDSLRVLPVNTARGCIFNCTFCYHVFKKKRYRIRSVENIVKEIKYLRKRYGVNYVQFSDELTLFSKNQVDRFAECFLKENLGIFWSADCRAGLFGEEDLNLALKLRKSGCIELGYSLESADEEILKAMNKNITVQDFTVQTKILQRAGISTSTSLVIGYPQETEETIKKTLNCCYENNIYPSTGYLLPQPGTPIYEYALKTGKIKNEEEYLLKMGDRQDFTVNLTGISQERMEELVRDYLKKIAEKMKLNLKEENLIKTGHYRQKKFSED
ncbi:MAG: radical SAM protein [Patescibacteria group bacterium]